jgi:hypothetical protein
MTIPMPTVSHLTLSSPSIAASPTSIPHELLLPPGENEEPIAFNTRHLRGSTDISIRSHRRWCCATHLSILDMTGEGQGDTG